MKNNSEDKAVGYSRSARVKRLRAGCLLRRWETALLLALCISSCTAAWAQKQQTQLASSLVRLHVVAASDEDCEQALKLRVRDAVLEAAQPVLSGASGRGAAERLLLGRLGEIEAAASAAAEGRAVRVSLQEEYFPTREYDNFALPAGNYMSLRVTIGAGAGRNWWCVVFPPLCMEAAEPAAQTGAMGSGGLELICGEGEGYQLRFRIVELWGQLCGKLQDRG